MNKMNLINRKGADCHQTTGNPILDLFVKQNVNLNKTILQDEQKFVELCNQLEVAFHHNPELYCKCLLLHRNIKNGNGYKFLFYMGMIVLRYINFGIYKEMLVQSIEHGYFKDILRLLKIVNLSRMNNNFILPKHLAYNSLKKGSKGKKMRSYLTNKMPIILDNVDELKHYNVDFEIQLYADLMTQSLKNVLNKSSNVNPFLFKYISRENGEFNVESELIWNYVEFLFRPFKI